MSTNPKPRRPSRRVRITAIHEAGHIIACLRLHVPFNSASIHADKIGLGRVVVDFASAKPENQIVVLLCGSAAERLLIPPKSRSISDWLASRADQQESEMLVSSVHPTWGEDQTTEYLKQMTSEADKLVADNKDAILDIAQALLERGKIEGREIVQGWQ
ncbi:MAG TPA: hypothetical protein VGK19_18235 [Capsulimonadaceae bacterium]